MLVANLETPQMTTISRPRNIFGVFFTQFP